MFGSIAPAAAMDDDFLGSLDIHGFVSQGFLLSDEYNYLSNKSKDGSFEYNEVGINFATQLTPRLGMGLQFFARDLGDAGNNDVTLDWAYGDYHLEDWLGLRFGKTKLPTGLWNDIRDYEMLRPWIVLPQGQGLYWELLRDFFIAASGVGLYGNIQAGSAGNVDYNAIVGNLSIPDNREKSKVLNEVSGGQLVSAGETETELVYTGNLRWNTPLPGLMIGGWSLYLESRSPLEMQDTGIDVDLKLELIAYGFMLEYIGNKFSLWAEYIIEDMDTEVAPYNIKATTHPEDYYLGAAYRFTRWFQVAAYYCESYADADDKDGSDQVDMGLGLSDHKAWHKDMALTLQFDLNDYWIFKVEGHLVDGTRRVIFLDNPNSDLSEQNFYYGAAKLSVSF